MISKKHFMQAGITLASITVLSNAGFVKADEMVQVAPAVADIVDVETSMPAFSQDEAIPTYTTPENYAVIDELATAAQHVEQFDDLSQWAENLRQQQEELALAQEQLLVAKEQSQAAQVETLSLQTRTDELHEEEQTLTEEVKAVEINLAEQTAVLDEIEANNFIFPVDDYLITSEFGVAREIELDSGILWTDVHNGTDFISQSEAQPAIKAVASGEVVYTQTDLETGYGVVIRHDNGLYSEYWHLSAVFPNVGDKIDQGQAIGIMGATGYAKGVHLHFGISSELFNGYIDPMSILGRNGFAERSMA